jgi:hypothetical protein
LDIRRSNSVSIVIADTRLVPQLKDMMTLIEECGDEAAMKQ